jgi:hypothetical protein
MAASKPIVLAIDTCVLLDLARPDDTTIDCFDTIVEKLENCVILVVPTVLQELQHISLTGNTSERGMAKRAFTEIIRKKYPLQPVNCVPVGHGIVERTGKKLISRKLLPEGEIHDSFVLAEAALAGASILISADTHLKAINRVLLKIAMDECDLSTPLIASPAQIVRDFYQTR